MVAKMSLHDEGPAGTTRIRQIDLLLKESSGFLTLLGAIPTASHPVGRRSSVHPLLLLADAPPLSFELRLPFSVLHFLEFAIWGAWFVVLGNYLDSLGFSRKIIGRIYATMPLGSVLSPMFVGTVADRYFASEHLMGALHIVGAGLLLWMATIRSPRQFYWVALIYALVYAP